MHSGRIRDPGQKDALARGLPRKRGPKIPWCNVIRVPESFTREVIVPTVALLMFLAPLVIFWLAAYD
jgi:hypothetical protein